MKFNINDYRGKYVMHCKTEEEAKDFCKYLHSVGRKWCSDESYLSNTEWSRYKEDTVYYFYSGMFGSYKYAQDSNYTILEWSDFMNSTFTKADLKTGDIIKQKNGSVAIVNADLGIAITRGGWLDLSNYNDDLTSKLVTGKDFDIVAVRRPKEKGDCQFSAFNYSWGTLVYDREREEPEEMTLAEVCKLLGKNIKIIQ